ncbi:MAG: biotin synthase BioB [Proteobacteria bacterium]|jgi:biotin synthase|nr:biotin synthase BioB [Pseudomonadota bacterium]
MTTQTAQLRQPVTSDGVRHDWSAAEVRALFSQPFNDLLFEAHTVHRANFNPNQVQLSTLLNIKSGGCPEDCAYCPQSVRFDTNVSADPVLPLQEVLQAAARAKAAGATRFCMGAAWRSPKDRDLDQVIPLIEGVRAQGLETCVTLGMLSDSQVAKLRDAGLDYYNHNLDTSPEFYGNIISTRTYDDRLNTLERVRDAGIKVCCGGIVGLGEGTQDRGELLRTLANLPSHPESVPINLLVRVEGTPLADAAPVHPIDFVRTVAVARILMPASHVRLSAGRTNMTDELQALCFFAGANSIFYGEQLLTTANPDVSNDQQLFARLGLSSDQHVHSHA